MALGYSKKILIYLVILSTQGGLYSNFVPVGFRAFSAAKISQP